MIFNQMYVSLVFAEPAAYAWVVYQRRGMGNRVELSLWLCLTYGVVVVLLSPMNFLETGNQ